MFDRPAPSLLIAEARRALDAGVATGFPQKVVANALGIAQRQLETGPTLADAEHARLRGLLDREGDLLRDQLAVAAGWSVIRITYRQLTRHAARTLELVRAAVRPAA